MGFITGKFRVFCLLVVVNIKSIGYKLINIVVHILTVPFLAGMPNRAK